MKEAKGRCWDLAKGVAGEVGCLAELVGMEKGEGGGGGGEGAGEGEGEKGGSEKGGSEKGDGGLFVSEDESDEGDGKANLPASAKQIGKSAARREKGGSKPTPPKTPDDLTEPLLSTLVSLIEWEDSARALRRQQEDVVRGLEGMGMGRGMAAEEARGVVGRLRGVMGRVAGVRWGLEDCLVLMGGEGV